MSLYLTLEPSDKSEVAKKAEKKRADGRKHCNKNPWSIEENFKLNIQSGILPGKAMIEEARKRYKILENRKWLVIRAKVNNIIKARK